MVKLRVALLYRRDAGRDVRRCHLRRCIRDAIDPEQVVTNPEVGIARQLVDPGHTEIRSESGIGVAGGDQRQRTTNARDRRCRVRIDVVNAGLRQPFHRPRSAAIPQHRIEAQLSSVEMIVHIDIVIRRGDVVIEDLRLFDPAHARQERHPA